MERSLNIVKQKFVDLKLIYIDVYNISSINIMKKNAEIANSLPLLVDCSILINILKNHIQQMKVSLEEHLINTFITLYSRQFALFVLAP